MYPLKRFPVLSMVIHHSKSQQSLPKLWSDGFSDILHHLTNLITYREYSHGGWRFIGHMPFLSFAKKFSRSGILFGLMLWYLTRTNSLFMGGGVRGGEWTYQKTQTIQTQVFWSETTLAFLIKIPTVGNFSLIYR